jgi:hypothetical protein
MRADQSLAGTVNGSIIDWLAGIASTGLLTYLLRGPSNLSLTE